MANKPSLKQRGYNMDYVFNVKYKGKFLEEITIDRDDEITAVDVASDEAHNKLDVELVEE